MAAISLDDVKHVAQLSHIAVSDDEAIRLQKELDTILGFVQRLNEADTAGVEPTYQVTGLANVTRPDELINYNVPQAELLKNAPAQQGGQLKVPKVL